MRLRFANCELDTDRQTLSRNGATVKIEPQVYDLLKLLVENPERLIPWEEIVEVVWQGRAVSDSAISARVAAVRKAVGDDGKRQELIRTVARRGLEIVVPVVSDQDKPAPVASSAPLKVRYARTDAGQSIAYAREGDGRRLMRIAAVPLDLRMEGDIEGLDGLNAAMAANFDYVRFDPIGYGLSDRDGGERFFDRAADDARSIADAIGWESFSVFSESGGFLDAIHLATMYPDRIEKMVVMGGYAEGRSVREGAQGPDVYREMLAQGWEKMDGGLAQAFMMAYFPEGPLEDVRRITHMMQVAGDNEVMVGTRDVINNASVLDLLPKVQCPVLIVHGRHDAVHPLSEARKLAAGIPNAELLILETANHLPMATHPTWKTFFAAFCEFING